MARFRMNKNYSIPNKISSYDNDYSTVPIGGGNPYQKCVYCGRSQPEINGYLNRHLESCLYRIQRENELGIKNWYDS